jgi:hypothetical protein
MKKHDGNGLGTFVLNVAAAKDEFRHSDIFIQGLTERDTAIPVDAVAINYRFSL